MMGINYLEAAKNQILAIEGEHPIEEVQVRALTAIADVLIHTAMKDERTCKDTTSEEHTQAFTCSECGCWVAYDEYWETGIYVQGEGQAVHIHPRYCPNCGRKVVE